MAFEHDWSDTDFQPDASSEHAASAFHLSVGMVIYGLFILVFLIFIWILSDRWAKSRALKKLNEEKNRASTYIYEAIKYHLDEALKIEGAAIIDHAKRLSQEINSRLGHVITLFDIEDKLTAPLAKAIKETQQNDKKDEKPTKKVAKSLDEQRVEIWQALYKLKEFWDKKEHVLILIRAAQDELCATEDEMKKKLGYNTAQTPSNAPIASPPPKSPQPPKTETKTDITDSFPADSVLDAPFDAPSPRLGQKKK